MDDNQFYIGDKLPIVYDVATTIHHLSTGGYKKGREKVIHAYATALYVMWKKAFGSDHVVALNTVKSRIDSHHKRLR